MPDISQHDQRAVPDELVRLFGSCDQNERTCSTVDDLCRLNYILRLEFGANLARQQYVIEGVLNAGRVAQLTTDAVERAWDSNGLTGTALNFPIRSSKAVTAARLIWILRQQVQ